jgi:hypothetical protein
MTLSTAGYTVGANQPLNRARILWSPITGTITADGTDGDLAANDYTFQRWAASAGLSRWTLTPAATVSLDTLFIAAHNLGGKTFRPQIGGASRTNLALRSEEMDNATWVKTRSTVTANATTAPDGTTTADKLVETAVAGTHIIRQTVTVAANTTHSFTAYVKGAERTNGLIRMESGADGIAGNFQLGAGTITLVTTGVGSGGVVSISALPDGWWRVRISGIINPTTTSCDCDLTLRDGANAASYTGDGTSGLFFWGTQLEVGAVPTSYVPTVAATAASDWHDLASWMRPDDNSTIAIMANNAGVPFTTGKFSLLVTDGTDVTVGIIRAGVALQMEQPVFGGVKPIGLTRMVETRHSQSETGQWLGRTIQRQASATEMNWTYLTGAWYRSAFQPFALSLPQTPFGLIQNPLRMPESVAWCWTEQTPAPENMGVLDFMQVGLSITGFLE